MKKVPFAPTSKGLMDNDVFHGWLRNIQRGSCRRITSFLACVFFVKVNKHHQHSPLVFQKEHDGTHYVFPISQATWFQGLLTVWRGVMKQITVICSSFNNFCLCAALGDQLQCVSGQREPNAVQTVKPLLSKIKHFVTVGYTNKI